MQQLALSRVVQDLIKAMSVGGDYTVVGTAGGDDGSIVATLLTVDEDGYQHSIDFRVSLSI